MLFPPWSFASWEAVDDRVRGGSSRSHLEPIDLSHRSDLSQLGEKKIAARFWGTLDTKTLGGAGFASQKYTFGPEPLHLPQIQYTGISVTTLPSIPFKTDTESKDITPHTFTLVLKTAPSPQRNPDKPKTPPNPEPATLSYESDFSTSHGKADLQGVKSYSLDFGEFKPMYRGREVPRDDPKYRPFDSSDIYEISLMCRSGFGKQEGDFELILLGIDGVKRKGSTSMRETCWNGVWNWMFGKRQGRVRLGN